MLRWHALLDPIVPIEETRRITARFPAIRFSLVELARRAASPPDGDDRLFVCHVTDLVAALLSCPQSESMRRLLEQRRAAAAAADA
jgi:hypothetical protein